MQNGSIELLRQKIDLIDKQLLQCIANRLKVVLQIGKIKNELNLPALDQARWQHLMQNRFQQADNLGIKIDLVEKIFNLLHAESLSLQEEMVKK